MKTGGRARLKHETLAHIGPDGRLEHDMNKWPPEFIDRALAMFRDCRPTRKK